MEQTGSISRLSSNLVMATYPTKGNMKNIDFVCHACKFESRSSGNYIIFDSDELAPVTKVLLYGRKTTKLSNELILDDTYSHPAHVESSMTKNISDKCPDYSPHIIKCYSCETITDVKNISINGKKLSFWNTTDYYPKFTVITVERGAMSLDNYIKENDVSIDELSGILFQILFALYTIKLNFSGFVHGDLLSQNIIMFKNNEYENNKNSFYEYVYNDRKFHIQARKFIPKIWDFEFSYADLINNNIVNNNHLGIKNDIYRLLISLRYDIYHTVVTQGIMPGAYEDDALIEQHKDVLPLSQTNQKEEHQPVSHVYNKINHKYDAIFKKFEFLSNDSYTVFLTNTGNMSYVVPNLENTIRRLSEVVYLEKFGISRSVILRTYPNLESYTSIALKGIKTTIKMVNFDFDQTLANYPFSKTPSSDVLDGRLIDYKDVTELFNNSLKLKMLFSYLRNALNIRIGIISFGNKDNIDFIIKNTFGNLIDVDDIIGTNRKFLCDETMNAKNNYLKHFSMQYNIPMENILFFDDEPDNINCANKIGVRICHVPKTGVTAEMIIDELNKYGARDIVGGYFSKYLKYKKKYLEIINK